MKEKSFIPFALPSIGEEEINEVVDSLRSGWVTTGPKVARFEEAFSEKVGAKYALAVNSATAGLHLALEAVGIRSGDKVVTTPYTFTATAEVIRYLGADPIFVDIDPQTFNLDVARLKAALQQHGDSIKAILPVHFAGLACDMAAISELAEEYDIPVIEDAAHAFPASDRGRSIGSIGTATVFSFYATKTICTGEGGMVVTDDESIAARIKVMRLHGINRNVWDRYTSIRPTWYYEVVEAGYKYNMTDIAAAMGLHQLEKAERFRQRREWISDQYSTAFANLPLVLPPRGEEDSVHAWHLYVVRLQEDKIKVDRNRFIELLAEEGIGTSVHFIPLHMQPYWKNKYTLKEEDFPCAARAYQHALSLPIYPDLTDDEVRRIIDTVTSIVEQYAC